VSIQLTLSQNDISIFRIYDTRYREQAGSVREGLWGLLIMRKVVLASALK